MIFHILKYSENIEIIMPVVEGIKSTFNKRVTKQSKLYWITASSLLCFQNSNVNKNMTIRSPNNKAIWDTMYKMTKEIFLK